MGRPEAIEKLRLPFEQIDRLDDELTEIGPAMMMSVYDVESDLPVLPWGRRVSRRCSSNAINET